jgi:hypothetical protein
MCYSLSSFFSTKDGNVQRNRKNCRCSTQASSTETMDEKKHAKDEKANLKIGDSESKD